MATDQVTLKHESTGRTVKVRKGGKVAKRLEANGWKPSQAKTSQAKDDG